jgi:hypothetical protein
MEKPDIPCRWPGNVGTANAAARVTFGFSYAATKDNHHVLAQDHRGDKDHSDQQIQPRERPEE